MPRNLYFDYGLPWRGKRATRTQRLKARQCAGDLFKVYNYAC